MKSLSSKYSMNGWSVIKTAEKVSHEIYKSETDSVMMTWFLLVKSGYDVKNRLFIQKCFSSLPS